MNRWQFVLLLVAQWLLTAGAVMSGYAVQLAKPDNPSLMEWRIETVLFLIGAFVCVLLLFLAYDKSMKSNGK